MQPFEERLKSLYEETYGELSYLCLNEESLLLAMFYFFYFAGDYDFFVAPISILSKKWIGFVNTLSTKEKCTLLLENKKHLSQLATKVVKYHEV